MENHFSINEFFPCCSLVERNRALDNDLYLTNLIDLSLLLNLIRYWFNKPIRITSGYRDKEHNKRVGGVSTSDHLTLSAVDVTCDDVNRLFNHIVSPVHNPWYNYGQVIYYPHKNIIHISIVTPKHAKETYINDGKNLKPYKI